MAGDGHFPQTRHSVVAAIRCTDRQRRAMAFETLVRAYWKPVYKYLRLRWRVGCEEAEDLTQGFFTEVIEKHVLDGYDPERARFRTWTRTCVDGFVANRRRAAGRLKRGGDLTHVSLDFESAEGELRHHEIAVVVDPDALFHREWLRSLLATAVEELRAWSAETGRDLDFEIFQRYDLAGADAERRPTYAEVARELRVPETKVTNALHAQRRRFRELTLAGLRRICGNDAEFRNEAREIFGVDPS